MLWLQLTFDLFSLSIARIINWSDDKVNKFVIMGFAVCLFVQWYTSDKTRTLVRRGGDGAVGALSQSVYETAKSVGSGVIEVDGIQQRFVCCCCAYVSHHHTASQLHQHSHPLLASLSLSLSLFPRKCGVLVYSVCCGIINARRETFIQQTINHKFTDKHEVWRCCLKIW